MRHAQAERSQFFRMPSLKSAELLPARGFEKTFASPFVNVRAFSELQPGLSQHGLQSREFLRKAERPAKIARRRSDGKHFAPGLKVEGAESFRPRQQRLEPRGHPKPNILRDQPVRREHAWRENGLAPGRGLPSQRLAQPSARLLRRHDDQQRGKIERAVP